RTYRGGMMISPHPTAAELFDISDEEMRSRKSLKWSNVEPDVLPAWVAEMDVQLAPAITNALQQALSRHDAGYPGSDEALSQAFASFAQDRWNWSIDTEHISVHIDAASIAAKLMREYAGADGKVMIMPPVYNRFYDWMRVCGVRPYEFSLSESSQGCFFDLEGIEAGLKSCIRVILLCNPHNLLGRVFAKEELSNVATLDQQYDAVVLSDEIHAPLVHPGVEYTPWL